MENIISEQDQQIDNWWRIHVIYIQMFYVFLP